jgi:hypothetical protein
VHVPSADIYVPGKQYTVGAADGDSVGEVVGLVGFGVGTVVGVAVGGTEGDPVGMLDGSAVGFEDGFVVGDADGTAVGATQADEPKTASL